MPPSVHRRLRLPLIENRGFCSVGTAPVALRICVSPPQGAEPALGTVRADSRRAPQVRGNLLPSAEPGTDPKWVLVGLSRALLGVCPAQGKDLLSFLKILLTCRAWLAPRQADSSQSPLPWLANFRRDGKEQLQMGKTKPSLVLGVNNRGFTGKRSVPSPRAHKVQAGPFRPLLISTHTSGTTPRSFTLCMSARRGAGMENNGKTKKNINGELFQRVNWLRHGE